MLLILAYAQMLIQQMDNSTIVKSDEPMDSCRNQMDSKSSGEIPGSNWIGDWLSCVWTSAQACSGGEAALRSGGTRFERILGSIQSFASGLVGFLIKFVSSLKLLDWPQIVGSVWLSQLGLPIVQRLIQSMAFQIYYIGRLLFASSEDVDDSRFYY